MSRRLTKAEVELIRSMYAGGAGFKAIAAKLGVHKRTVTYWLRDGPGAQNGCWWTDEDRAQLKAMVLDGKPNAEIAEALGRSVKAVRVKIQEMRTGAWDKARLQPQKPDAAAPEMIASRKHLTLLHKANGYGFAWWPEQIMEQVYLLERAPTRVNEFWRAA